MTNQNETPGSEGQPDQGASQSPRSGYPEIGIGLGFGVSGGAMLGSQLAGTGGISATPWLELGVGVGVASGVSLGLMLGRALRQNPLPWKESRKLLTKAWLAGAFMLVLAIGSAVGEAAGGAGGRWLWHGIVLAVTVVTSLVIARARLH
jgi:hypothetical protein